MELNGARRARRNRQFGVRGGISGNFQKIQEGDVQLQTGVTFCDCTNGVGRSWDQAWAPINKIPKPTERSDRLIVCGKPKSLIMPEGVTFFQSIVEG